MPKAYYPAHQPMRIQARPNSLAETKYYAKNALPNAWPMPKAIAPGIDPAPLEDLIFHGGKVVAVTATFRMLYVFVVIEHGTRRLAHVSVTAHPSADWTLQQLREVVGEEGGHQYLSMTETRCSPSILMIQSGPWVSKCCDHRWRVPKRIQSANA